jgi:hypothetical protein
MRMELRLHAEAVDDLSVRRREWLAVARPDQRSERSAEVQVRLTVGVGEALFRCEQAALDEEGPDHLERGVERSAVRGMLVQVEEALEDLEVPGRRGGGAEMPVDVEHRRLKVYTSEMP